MMGSRTRESTTSTLPSYVDNYDDPSGSGGGVTDPSPVTNYSLTTTGMPLVLSRTPLVLSSYPPPPPTVGALLRALCNQVARRCWRSIFLTAGGRWPDRIWVWALSLAAVSWPLWVVLVRRYVEYRLGKLVLYCTRIYKAHNMPKRLLLIRHAESEGNVSSHIYERKTDSDIRLTEHGHGQAFRSGLRLFKLMGNDTFKIYCSPYTRAKQTINGMLSGFEVAKEQHMYSNRFNYAGILDLWELWTKWRRSHGQLNSVYRSYIEYRNEHQDDTTLVFEGISNGIGSISSSTTTPTSNIPGCLAQGSCCRGSASVPSLRRLVHAEEENGNRNELRKSNAGDDYYLTSSNTEEEFDEDETHMLSPGNTPSGWANRPNSPERASVQIDRSGRWWSSQASLTAAERNRYQNFCSRYDIQEELRLREQETGFGKRLRELRNEMPHRAYHGYLYYRFFGGESGADVYDRISAFVEKLHHHFLTEQCANNFVIVSHGVAIKVMLMRLLHCTVDDFQSYDNIHNAEIVVLEKTPESRYRLASGLRRRRPLVTSPNPPPPPRSSSPLPFRPHLSNGLPISSSVSISSERYHSEEGAAHRIGPRRESRVVRAGTRAVASSSAPSSPPDLSLSMLPKQLCKKRLEQKKQKEEILKRVETERDRGKGGERRGEEPEEDRIEEESDEQKETEEEDDNESAIRRFKRALSSPLEQAFDDLQVPINSGYNLRIELGQGLEGVIEPEGFSREGTATT